MTDRNFPSNPMTPQWISVDDRYPEVGQDVVYFFDVCGTYVGKYLGEHCFGGECGFLTDDVTHWMPYKTSSRKRAVETGAPTELRAVCEEIRNKAQSSVGNYGLGNFVAIHRELLGSMCAILDRTAETTAKPPSVRIWAEEAKNALCNVAQLMDAWKQTAPDDWTEWDQLQRDQISRLLSSDETTAPLTGDTAELMWRAFRALRRDDYEPGYKAKLAEELDDWLKRNTVKAPVLTTIDKAEPLT